MEKIYAVEHTVGFIAEKRKEAYIWFVGVSITGKNSAVSQKHLSAKLLVRLDERCGA